LTICQQQTTVINNIPSGNRITNAYKPWLKCKIGGPGTVCGLGALVTKLGTLLRDRGGALEYKIKKEDAVKL